MSINRRFKSGAAPSASGLGTQVPGAQVAASSGRGITATAKWTPTVANLMVLIVLEVLAFAALRYLINRIV